MLGLDYTSRGRFILSLGITAFFLAIIFFLSYNIFLIERLERYNDRFIQEANNTADILKNKNEDAILDTVVKNVKWCPLFTLVLLFGGFISTILGFILWIDEDKRRG